MARKLSNAYRPHSQSENVRSQLETIEIALPPMEILIVDDEPVNLQVLKNYFSVLNVKVTLCLSGTLALADILEKKSVQKKYDLMLLDIMMPKMNGFEVLKQLREIEGMSVSEFPVILLTAKKPGR